MSISVTISICTRNRASHLRETLRAMNRVSIPQHLDPELVVVDNGSTDATAELLSNPPLDNLPLRPVTESREGVSRARNAALNAAQGRLLLWLDDDVHVSRDWLMRMTRPLLEDEVDAVTGKVVLAPHLKRPWMQSFHRTALASTASINPEDPKNIISANMGFDRSVLADVSGFDPELGPGSRVGALEDTLFSWQLREAGHSIGMVTETVAEHHFDEQRLTRDAFIQAGIARGQSLAYIRYHWLHNVREDWTHRTRPYQVWRHPQIVHAIRTIDWRIRRWLHRFTERDAPIGKREFWTILNAYNIRQYLVERRRPRNYERKGLHKIRGKRPEHKPS